jgi:hypothetical protein
MTWVFFNSGELDSLMIITVHFPLPFPTDINMTVTVIRGSVVSILFSDTSRTLAA